MSPCRFVLVSLLSGAACLDMPAANPDAVSCPPPPDLAQPLPKCAAAKGLAGDNLICADFNQIPSVPDAQRLPGWDFYCLSSDSWGVINGMLQMNNFAMFRGNCQIRLPAINLADADKSKYKSLTLSLIHHIDLFEPEQRALVYLNSTDDQTLLMYSATGKKLPNKQQTTITIDTADLPALIHNTPQWRLMLAASGNGGRQGWQIESIAVNGMP